MPNKLTPPQLEVLHLLELGKTIRIGPGNSTQAWAEEGGRQIPLRVSVVRALIAKGELVTEEAAVGFVCKRPSNLP